MADDPDVELAQRAVTAKVVSKDDALACLKELKAIHAQGIKKKIGELFVEKKMLRPIQVVCLMMGEPVPGSPGGPPLPPPGMTTMPTKGAAGQKSPSAPAVNPAEPVPGYLITGKIGQGGMASVFRATQKETGVPVALKILYPHHAKNPLFLKRFKKEARLLVEFDHPNVVKGVDHGTANGLSFAAMELLEGDSIQNLLDRDGPLSDEKALGIILKVAEALEYIQGKGILHRDIKPDNIMITKTGEIKLCDLGFAKTIGAAEESEGTTCGTAQYMSPEQAQGQRDMDIRSDIYALGATLYHMAMGSVPFKGGDSLEIMAKQVMEDLSSTEAKNKHISHHMHYFIERMMAKEKDLRYTTPRELIEDIEAQMEGIRTLEFNPDEAVGGPRKPFTARGPGLKKPPSSPRLTPPGKPPSSPKLRRPFRRI